MQQVVREAIANAAKHAAAHKVQVRVRSDDGGVAVEVEDDGLGFDPDTTPDAARPPGAADGA